jgi:hypothetical protein
VFFSRFYTNTLPYNSDFIKRHYIQGADQDSASASSTTSTSSTSSSSSSDKAKFSILLCPSFGANSILSSPALINAIIELVQEYKHQQLINTERKYDIVFTLKVHQSLHPSTSEQERLHPLMWISEIERQHVAILAQYIQLADVEHYNILPFMEAHDVVCRCNITCEMLWRIIVD